MLTLVTGLPGHGKSLYTITKIKELSEKTGRMVFYAGMTDVKLPWTEIDGDEWYKCPEGSIIVIDEAQRNFPVRPPKEPVPDKCSQFETHRHKGFDIYLITQDSMLIDHHVRRLAGQYFRIVRPFGQNFANVYEFQRVVQWDDYHEQKNALKSVFKYPIENYNLYRSAEIHTVKRRFPKKLLWVPVLFCVISGSIYLLYHTLWGKKHDVQTIAKSSDIKSTAIPVSKTQTTEHKPLSLSEYVNRRAPRVYDMPESAPMYDEIAKPTAFPIVSACVITDDKCKCYSQQGTLLDRISAEYCNNFVAHGAFNPYLEHEGGQRSDAQRDRGLLDTSSLVNNEVVAEEPKKPYCASCELKRKENDRALNDHLRRSHSKPDKTKYINL